jgi:cephalosporin-C deacetylase
MPWFDLPLADLRTYRTATEEPPGLDEWWRSQLDKARALAEAPTVTRYEPAGYGPAEVYDVAFSGARGDRIRAWYIRPPASADGATAGGASADGAAPVVVKFIGYGGGRGLPADHMLLPAVGYPVFVMDSRGQGGRWTIGATGDQPGEGPEYSTVMTRGLDSPEGYYFTRLFTDAVRAVETAAELAGGPDGGAGPARIAVTGVSQGGGLALATAGLLGDTVTVCHADVPFLCDIQRGITTAPAMPYAEVAEFLATQVGYEATALDTLRYVDCALLARRITAQSLLSVGLMDTICPPSTVFAAYNEITAPKDIAVFSFGVHAVPPTHLEHQLRHLRTHLPA